MVFRAYISTPKTRGFVSGTDAPRFRTQKAAEKSVKKFNTNPLLRMVNGVRVKIVKEERLNDQKIYTGFGLKFNRL